MRRVALFGLAALIAACGGKPPPTVKHDESKLPSDAPTPPTPKPGEPAAAPAPGGDAAGADAPLSGAARDLLEEGKEVAAQGDLSGAEKRYRDALVEEPRLAEAAYNLGVLAEWQGRYDQAREAYESALRAREDYGPAVVAIANLMLRNGDKQGALSYAESAVERDPESNSLKNALNRIRLAFEGRANDVIRDSKLVLRNDEKNVAAMVNLAAAFHAQGKYELAIAILENAKALDDQDPEIYARIALAHEALNDDIKARVTLEAAVALAGGASAEIYNNLGVVYATAGDYIGAEEQFRMALARWPHMAAAQVNLGNALKGQQRYADADKALREALTIDPSSADAVFNLGILYLDGDLPGVDAVSRLEQALQYFEQYKAKAPARAADDPVELYVAEAKKKVEVERKRAAQMRNVPKPPPEEPEGGADDGGDDAGGGEDGAGETPTEDDAAPEAGDDGAAADDDGAGGDDDAGGGEK